MGVSEQDTSEEETSDTSIIRLIIPNVITVSAILAGYLSILTAFHGDYRLAAGFILVACVLDMLDGGIARAINATTEFGVQLDSLADMVNYGVAPALLFYFRYFEPWGVVGMILSFIPVCCAGIRLARFNMTADPDIPTRYFVGLPTTIGALVLAGFVIFEATLPSNHNSMHEAAFLITLISLLMVSNVQYEKGNILSLRYIRKTRRIITASVILISLILIPETAFFAWGLLYIMYGFARSLGRVILHGDDEATEGEIDEEYDLL